MISWGLTSFSGRRSKIVLVDILVEGAELSGYGIYFLGISVVLNLRMLGINLCFPVRVYGVMLN